MHSRRRRSITKERASLGKAGVHLKRLAGEEITEQDIEFFYQCYQQTYLQKSGHHGYLTEDFFKQIYASMGQHLMLVIAYQQDEKIASALFVFDQNKLCGRYWGAIKAVDKLHFEACYYQGIEFCIERNIPSFNPGTQGEHKILRGFEPIYCYSNHYLAELAFHEAVERFVTEETPQIEKYKHNAEKLLPFKDTDSQS
jgi:predicted N-acyltransferase